MASPMSESEHLLQEGSAQAVRSEGQCRPSKVACVGLAAFAGAASAAVLYVRPSVAHQAARASALRAQQLFLDSYEQASQGRICRDYTGVKLAEVDPVSLWVVCAEKWSEDCRDSGCCVDEGMRCFEKNSQWAACKSSCSARDDKNESWTCEVIEPVMPRNMDTCRESCRLDKNCKQAIFDWYRGGSCSLSQERVSNIVWAADNFNSTVCGSELTEGDKMSTIIDEVTAQLPFVLPSQPIEQCSWGGEDCRETKCCNNVNCDAQFHGCYPYSCYKKNDYFAGCLQNTDSVPFNETWDMTWLGGGRQIYTVPPAASQVAMKETTLYCFMVVNWQAPAPKPFWSTEGQLADNIKQHGVSIFQCDGHDIYDGEFTPKAEWGSFSNIDAFMNVWQKVKDNGAYKNYEWTIKVDADAVFIPYRLKQHLDKLRTPKGARVYVENVDFQFRFMGALEVMTREAVDLFLEMGQTCIRGKHDGGEDFFMKGCLDAIGVDHQSDYDLLKDKYAAQDGPCTDGWAVAYHFHKKVNSWNWCYNEIMCGNRGKTCPEGLEVPFVMPWVPNPIVPSS